MGAGLLTKSSDLMVRRELFNLSASPAARKSVHLPSRVCFGRKNKTLVNHTLVLSAPRNDVILSNNDIITSSPPPCFSDSCSFSFENKNNPLIVNNNHSVLTVSNKMVEIKKKVFKVLASLLLFGFLAFMTTPRRLQGVSALAAVSPSYTSSSSSSSFTCTKCDCPTRTQSSSTCNCFCHIAEIIAYSFVLSAFLSFLLSFLALPLSILMLVALVKMLVALVNIFLIIAKIISILLAVFIMVASVNALLNGYRYFLQLCMDERKSVLVLQVGVLDNMRELQRELAQITYTSNLDGMKLEGVVKALVQHCDSCHFAYIAVTKGKSDEEMKFEHDNDAEDSISSDHPFAFAVSNWLESFVKTLVEIIHGALKTIKKINYNDKCSKQLFREVLTSELVRYDKDKETTANVDGIKYEKKDVGKENSMVDNDYLVVTIFVLASGIYSIPSSMCNTEHVKTALQELNTIPKSKIESMEVLWTPETEDEVVSEQELQRDFPLLKPVD